MQRTRLLRVLVVVVALISLVALSSGALADTIGVNFETYSLGNVNGQDGWSKTGPFDVAVVANSYGYGTFGAQSLRISNAVTSGSFGDQTFAKPLINAVGETAATAGAFSEGTRQNHFEMQFDIASTQASVQSGMVISVSPDRGDGSRMSYLRFEDAPGGINVFFDDVQQATACTPASCANFVETQVGTNLSRATPHTIKLTMDTPNGPSNDVVKVFIDGILVHTGTSWEDYYRYDPEAASEQSPRIVKTVIFRAGGTAVPANAGNGFLIDNLTTLSSCTGIVTNVNTSETFCTIQAAIDDPDTLNGHTISVGPGTYVEDLVIDKSVTLLGPNANINPNTGTRVAEATLYPAVSVPDPNGSCEVMAYIDASDVTINGFTFDGDNPALTSGIIIDGADVDACEIIASYEGVGDIIVENNILKHSTYSGVDLYNYYNSGGATAGNYIRYNRLEDIGETTYNWGIGVLVYNNFYADITNNVMTGVRTGVQTGNYYNANPGTTGSISNNQIGVWRLGIFHNLAYGSASPFTISGNTITAETYPGATKWNGLLLSSIQSAVNATITNNDIVIPGAVSFAPPNYTAGYNVWNVITTAPIAINGGTVTGGDYGVFVNNYEGYSSNANNTAVKIDDVTIVGSDVAGVYVKDSPSNTNGATVYANIQNSAIDTDGIGILVEGADATATANNNDLAGNPTFGVKNTGSALMDAENNWWGSACSPASLVSGNVDFTPWWGDPAGSFSLSANATTINPGDSAAQQMAVINCAAPGTTITYPTGPFPGGVIVTANDVTINLNGSTVGYGSSAYTIVGDDVTLTNGILDGTGEPLPASPGVLVQAGADNFILDRMQVKNWADGVQVAGLVDGDIESLKIVNNWIHSNTGSGLQVDKQVAGVVTIQGNLFKVNTGNGVDYGGAGMLNAEYNSWGADQGPAVAGGDGAGATVDFDPWTFAEVYIDVDPASSGDQIVRGVNESTSFDVALNVDGENLYGLSFKFTYNPAYITFNGPPTFAAPWAGNCAVVGTPPAGTFAYNCYLTSGPAWDGGTVATFNFTATDNGGYTPPPGPWTTYFDISALPAETNAGAVGGVKVFVNNAGFNNASVMPDRDITDTNDGQINITGIAQFTGFVDLQGRPNDSGALVEAKDGVTVKANATSASSGKYTTSYMGAFLLAIGASYDVNVDRALYLPATKPWTLTTRPLTTLTTVLLLGGDADNNNVIGIDDATCVGGAYGFPPAVCGTGGSSDVNGDGFTNILDLVLFGGNYGQTVSPW